METENRLHTRAKVKWPVSIKAPTGIIDGTTENLSLSGAFIRLSRQLNSSAEIPLALNAKGRLDWLQEDFDELTDINTYSPPEDGLWKRVKGRQKLKGVQLAILRDLAIWREDQAKKASCIHGLLLAGE